MSKHYFLLLGIVLVMMVTPSWSQCTSISPGSNLNNELIGISGSNGVFTLTPFTPTSTIIVTSLSINVSATTTNIILGIYNNDAINQLIAQTSQFVLNNANGLVGADLITPITLSAGSLYYLAFGSSDSMTYVGTGGPLSEFGGYTYDPTTLPPTMNFIGNIPIIVVFTLTICPTVAGDPSFVGLMGQSYQVHGIDGEVYNLITDINLQVNALFVFLNEGQCPILNNGHPGSNCWSHPGSYLGEIGIQTVIDGVLQQFSFIAGDRVKGFQQVQINGKTLVIGDSFSIKGLTIHFNTSHLITVDTDLFKFSFENSDMFINQALRPNVPISKLNTHGLLGQTHSKKIYANAIKYVEGDVDDYIINGRQIFGNDFIFNKFEQFSDH